MKMTKRKENVSLEEKHDRIYSSEKVPMPPPTNISPPCSIVSVNYSTLHNNLVYMTT